MKKTLLFVPALMLASLTGCGNSKKPDLVSIALEGTPTTSYTVNDAFIKPTIVATYSDESTKDVTEKTVFSGYNMATAGDYTVEASYTERSITKTLTYDIKVNVPQPIPNDSGLPTTIDYLDEPAIQIHYTRYPVKEAKLNSYKVWGLWLWAEGKDGDEYEFNYADENGVIAYYPLSHFGNPRSLGFIVKELFSSAGSGVWNKDVNSDRFMDIDMLQIDEHQSYHVYLNNGNPNVYTDPERHNLMNAVTTCQFESTTKIKLETNNAMSDPVFYKNGVAVTSGVTITGNTKSKVLTLSEPISIEDACYLHIEFENGGSVDKNISIRKLYDMSFEMAYQYSGELGAIYSPEHTIFKVWSPISTSIKLRIYENGTPTEVDATKGSDVIYKEEEMTKGEKGVFSAQINEDLEGKYYTYFVTNSYNPYGKEIVDPYAKGAGVNGLRGMIVDFSKTNPTGWDEVGYSQVDKKHLTIYETHVADMTSSETWTGLEANRKRYAGMHETGTTYTENIDGQDVTVKTGFDHVKELGVNAIQIIPFFDQANNETKPEFNWGYNPLNYNVVEGVYSSNPYDGYVRMQELKAMIQAYKEAGIAVIMDVVYNHVNGLSGSNFDVLMPFYYFRYTDTGGAWSGSGCGNDTASETSMFRKFMIDSTAFWTEEYKMDGFRFDLMGLHDTETMNQLVAKCKTINPNIVVNGEAWNLTSGMKYGYKYANQTNANDFVGYGQFNDKVRDAMQPGGFSPLESKGWISSTTNPVGTDTIIEGMKGITHGVTNDPNKTLNYVTCHDNYTIHDRQIKAGIYDESLLAKINVLGNAFIMLSRGISFMLAGEEMLRTKIDYDVDGNPMPLVDDKGEEIIAYDKDGQKIPLYSVSGNSYNSSYKTNEINYSWKAHHLDMFESYKKFIPLKQKAVDLGLDTSTETFKVEALAEGTVIKVTFAGGEACGNHSYVGYFTSPSIGTYKGTSYSAEIPAGATVYLDTEAQNITGNSVNLKPYEVLILELQQLIPLKCISIY